MKRTILWAAVTVMLGTCMYLQGIHCYFFPGLRPPAPIRKPVTPGDAALLRKGAQVVEADWKSARQKRQSEVLRLLGARKYGALEKMAEGLRRSKGQHPNGHSHLWDFYIGLTDLPESATDIDWENRMRQLQEWAERDPKSFTARVAVARGYWYGAYRARGQGFASTVTPEMEKLKKERLEQAFAEVSATMPLRNRCPGWYLVAQRVGRLMGWPREEYDTVVDEALAKFPEYRNLHLERAYFLLPRWYGDNGEWEEYAAKESDKVGGVEGDILYAQFCWNFQGASPLRNVFRESKLSWPRARKGYEALLKRHPDSFDVANAYANAAYLASDTIIARPLFRHQIRNRLDMDMWRSRKSFERAQRQALTQ